MRRFYKDVAVISGDAGHEIQLDGRPVRTPARASLALPTLRLAAAVADEWRAQGESVDPRTMPFTGLANGAIDQIAPNRESFAAGIARYGESDLLCYRADGPAELIAREAAAWDPLIDWARHRYDVTFRVTHGVIPVDQPPETLERLEAAVMAYDPFMLAGLSTLVTLSGSLVCGLAIVEGGHDADTIWTASEIDEAWEIEQWGEDAEAAARSAKRRDEFAMARRFCALVSE
ncbi:MULTISPECIES: ATP12 family chaperone protein [Sphingobium]|uniref:ATP12 family chaperone protein n=1 Tax=Sphingobium tyrosinilyticum TaxID=2715436 RepID=A0ABV9F3K0_9SPHN|nr:ATP12 family protein [Sphingobium sp. EP60837]ANI78907.1 ATP synthase mitochondrial F1 complex assembly factor [Sphingobium sp. EP60837]